MRFVFALCLTLGSGSAFVSPETLSFTRSAMLNVVSGGEQQENFLDRVDRILQDAPRVDEQFEYNLKTIFPDAISNSELEYRVTDILYEKGFTSANTLLATSLCSDELARRLEDDFVKIYGNNFNLGGLAGFPFAGNIGFETMSGHIPDDGFCLLVYGPHVGVSRDGTIGKVEREGVTLVDDCCRSAVEAFNYLSGTSAGADIQQFTDLQQGAVQNLMTPMMSDCLDSSDYPMLDLPYALYDSQDTLVRQIVNDGASRTKRGLALLGGIQINTGPYTPDFFHPLCFDYMNNRGKIVEDMLPRLLHDRW